MFERTYRQPHPHFSSHLILQRLFSEAALSPSIWCIFFYYSLVWTCIRMELYVVFIYGVIMLSTCASRTIHIYWWFSDYNYIEKWGKLGHHHVGANCRFATGLYMAKWLRKWQRGWLYFRSNTKNAKSLFSQTGKVSILLCQSEYIKNYMYNRAL